MKTALKSLALLIGVALTLMAVADSRGGRVHAQTHPSLSASASDGVVSIALSDYDSYDSGWWFRINGGTCTQVLGGSVSGIKGYSRTYAWTLSISAVLGWRMRQPVGQRDAGYAGHQSVGVGQRPQGGPYAVQLRHGLVVQDKQRNLHRSFREYGQRHFGLPSRRAWRKGVQVLARLQLRSAQARRCGVQHRSAHPVGVGD